MLQPIYSHPVYSTNLLICAITKSKLLQNLSLQEQEIQISNLENFQLFENKTDPLIVINFETYKVVHLNQAAINLFQCDRQIELNSKLARIDFLLSAYLRNAAQYLTINGQVEFCCSIHHRTYAVERFLGAQSAPKNRSNTGFS